MRGQLIEARIRVDGEELAQWQRPLPHSPRPDPMSADGFFGEREPSAGFERIAAFDLPLTPGVHRFDLEVTSRVWVVWCAYCRAMRPYRFRVRTSIECRVARDPDVAGLTLIAYEQGGVTTPVEERPRLRLETLIIPPPPPGTPGRAAHPPRPQGRAEAHGQLPVIVNPSSRPVSHVTL